MIWGGPYSNMTGVLIKRGRDTRRERAERDDHGRTPGKIVLQAKDRCLKKTTLPTPSSCTSSLQNCQTGHFCRLSCLLCGALLWQLERLALWSGTSHSRSLGAELRLDPRSSGSLRSSCCFRSLSLLLDCGVVIMNFLDPHLSLLPSRATLLLDKLLKFIRGVFV